MPRPKKGTPAHELATARWRQTISSKYGSPSEHMARIGAKGGKKTAADGVIKGFAANRELAVAAGQKGGSVSRRGKASENA